MNVVCQSLPSIGELYTPAPDLDLLFLKQVIVNFKTRDVQFTHGPQSEYVYLYPMPGTDWMMLLAVWDSRLFHSQVEYIFLHNEKLWWVSSSGRFNHIFLGKSEYQQRIENVSW